MSGNWRRWSWVFWMMAAASAWAETTPTIDPVDLEAFVDGFVEARMLDRGVVGVTVSVVHGGRRIFSKGYGYDDLAAGRPVEPARSLFRPGSISKTLTWTAVMQLYEQGRLDLTADIQTYLPNVPIAEAFDAPITMLDLMGHRPGFEDSSIGHLFEGEPDQVLPLVEYLRTHQPARVRPPGGVPAYSNYGSGLAGQIVANLSGELFEDYVDQHVTGPLGMRHTTFREPWGPQRPGPMSDELAQNVSKGYIKIGADYESTDFTFVGQLGPAGALSTTADDMATWMLAHLGNGEYGGARILESNTARLMHTEHVTLDPLLPGMAHGFIESDLNGHRAYGHGGGLIHFLSDLQIVPDLDLGVFISTNTTGAGGYLISDFARELVRRYFEPGPNLMSPTPGGDVSPYVGTYILSRRAFTTVERLNLPVVAVGEAADGGLAVTFPPESRRFEPAGENLFQSARDPDQKLLFVLGDDGAADRLYLSVPIMIGERAGLLDRPQVVFGVLGVACAVFFCVLVGAWLRRGAAVAQTVAERWAAVALYTTCATWLVALGGVVASFVRLTADIRTVFFGFPTVMFRAALTITIIATALTALSLVLTFGVWSRRSWPRWRRIRHSGVILAAVAVVLVLYRMNAIGYHYF